MLFIFKFSNFLQIIAQNENMNKPLLKSRILFKIKKKKNEMFNWTDKWPKSQNNMFSPFLFFKSGDRLNDYLLTVCYWTWAIGIEVTRVIDCTKEISVWWLNINVR